MRYGVLSLLAFTAVPLACAVPAEDTGAAASSTSVTNAATLVRFNADWSITTSGPLVAGSKAEIRYDVSRLPSCRGDVNGGPAWSISGSYRINGGPVGGFEAGGLSPSHGTARPIIDLTAPGDLEIWFSVTNPWGCIGYDSSYGKNYHLTIAPPANAPGWLGNAARVISRATCDMRACDGDRSPLENGFSYDTWARQRAAIRAVYFDVWKQGTTDRDNPNLWRELDAQVHYRFGSGVFTASYVDFEKRVGNDARYIFDLRALDPFPSRMITDKADCPKVPMTISPDAQYVETTVDLYFTVNGVELRPSAGATYHGTFADYRGLYSICEGH